MEGLQMPTERNYQEVSIDLLIPFKDHPFKLYDGQRFIDMVESIRANGVIAPITIRPADDGKYEILSGHNRTEAAKEAGLETIPAIVREGLTDDEALLVVTESNLIQRSFADLKHSERAIALSAHYEAMKKKSGYRSDLLEGIEYSTSAPLGRRSETREELGTQYHLSKNTIARYLRVNKLVPELKERLDNEEIGMRVAESLSYLRPKEQRMVDRTLANDPNRKLTMKGADDLRKASAEEALDNTAVRQLIPLTSRSRVVIKPKFIDLDYVAYYLESRLTAAQCKDESLISEIEGMLIKALNEYLGLSVKEENDSQLDEQQP
jgi:ParB family chromosome partitioning protein